MHFAISIAEIVKEITFVDASVTPVKDTVAAFFITHIVAFVFIAFFVINILDPES
jgi:hypothetical protein